jgi:hypothetical protein
VPDDVRDHLDARDAGRGGCAPTGTSAWPSTGRRTPSSRPSSSARACAGAARRLARRAADLDGKAATRQALRRGDQRPRPGAARAVRRVRGPGRIQQHRRGGRGRLRRRRPARAQPALRRPRARDGLDGQRHGAARRDHPLRRDVPGVHRLLPAGDPARVADAAAGRLRDDPRLDRARRGRTDPPAGRAPHGAAGDPGPDRRAAGRRRRDGAGVGARDRTDGPTVLALTRQGLPPLGEVPADGVRAGAYVLADPGSPTAASRRSC